MRIYTVKWFSRARCCDVPLRCLMRLKNDRIFYFKNKRSRDILMEEDEKNGYIISRKGSLIIIKITRYPSIRKLLIVSASNAVTDNTIVVKKLPLHLHKGVSRLTKLVRVNYYVYIDIVNRQIWNNLMDIIFVMDQFKCADLANATRKHTCCVAEFINRNQFRNFDSSGYETLNLTSAIDRLIELKTEEFYIELLSRKFVLNSDELEALNLFTTIPITSCSCERTKFGKNKIKKPHVARTLDAMMHPLRKKSAHAYATQYVSTS
ncbi:hypothetical protein AGLY_005156 [Aphis glycines]|uniref:Uncharacterized protein n=1 Tax=Aphis glycines TaxID=307491 RepID=A0A6G0TWB6_APHGL|nr:hypothetical protein AGLY_005156 [Aphis glycines]